MLQNQFKLATLITVLCSAGAGMASPDLAYAQDASELDLAPLVMIIFDTSNSMNYDYKCKTGEVVKQSDGTFKCKNGNPIHTRLTKAIAEIAGYPKDTQERLDNVSCVEQCTTGKLKTGYDCKNYGSVCVSCDQNNCEKNKWVDGKCTDCKENSSCKGWNPPVCCDSNGKVTSYCYNNSSQECKKDTDATCYRNRNRPRKHWECDATDCRFVYENFAVSTPVSHIDSRLYDPKNPEEYENAYDNNGVLQAYQYAVKFGFASMCTSRVSSNHVNSTDFSYRYNHLYEVNGVSGCGPTYNALSENNLTKIHSTSTQSENIRDAEGLCSGKIDGVNNLAPLIYPTVSNDENDIYEHNSAVIASIRSYSGFASTPILGVLRDFRALFGDGETLNADKCMYTQKIKKDGVVQEVEDEHYLCRPKAIIFITDGDNYYDVFKDNDDCKGSSHCSKIENFDAFAKDLYKNNVKIYPVGFAEGFDVDTGTNAGKKLNHMAWKGGTCLKKDGTILDPLDEDMTPDDFNALFTGNNPQLMLGEGNNKNKQCFYDARDPSMLRLALKNALSDMLKSFKSKTRIATTTALGRIKNYVNIEGDSSYFYNGYYNVYSGYDITVGQVRRTILERETQLCDRDDPASNGFKPDSSQFIDMAARLNCMLTGCVKYEKTDEGFLKKVNDLETAQRAGYTSFQPKADDPTARPEPCATDYDQTSGSFGDTISYTTVNAKNTCSSKRNIFAGDYTQDRYAIHPAAYSILKTTSTLNATNDLKTTGEGGFINAPIYAGYIRDGRAANSNYQFIIHNPMAANNACSANMNHPYTESNNITADYILTPYECITALDCPIMEGEKPLECDLGRCVASDDYNDKQKICDSNRDGKVCIAKRLREKHNDCNKHADCVDKCSANGTADGGCVCHAGQCVPGIVKDCDIRQFLATQKLGTIEYASPTVVEPPTRNYKSATYQAFKNKYWTRDTMLMVGANDGMLHAFVLGYNGFAKYEKAETQNTYALSDAIASKPSAKNVYGEGDELWGFIPKGVMPNVAKLINYGPQQHVNSTPITSDVLSPIDHEWHTVVLGGLGNGGRSYYALDVSNPAQPKILWEIDHQWQPWENPEYPDMAASMSKIIEGTSAETPNSEMQNRERLESNTGYPFQLLGKAVIEPAITMLNIDGTLEPVAIIPAGDGTTETDDRIGCALYIVRLFPTDKEHLLVKTFYFDDPITSTPSVYPNNFNAIGQLIYVGDKKGALYRLDVSSSDVADWSGETKSADGTLLTEKDANNDHEPPIFDPSSLELMGSADYNAITFKPAVSLYSRTGSTVIQLAFGTGTQRNLAVEEDDHNYIANFYDSCTPSSIVRDDQAVSFYSCTLNPASGSSRFTSQIHIFNPPSGVQSSDNPQTEGAQQFTIKTYQDDKYQMMTGPAITYNFKSYYPLYTTENRTCALGHASLWQLYSSQATRHTAMTDVQSPNAKASSAFSLSNHVQLGTTGTKVYGLQITNQMVCLSKDNKTSSVIAPQLIAQTGKSTQYDAKEGAKDSRLTIPSMALDLEAIEPTSQIVSWASVYE